MTDDDPIVPESTRAHLNAVAKLLDKALNPSGPDGEVLRPRKNGFVLFQFPFGAKAGEGRVNYISNATRGEMIDMVSDWLARQARDKQ
jgi:hypothetical protein